MPSLRRFRIGTGKVIAALSVPYLAGADKGAHGEDPRRGHRGRRRHRRRPAAAFGGTADRLGAAQFDTGRARARDSTAAVEVRGRWPRVQVLAEITNGRRG